MTPPSEPGFDIEPPPSEPFDFSLSSNDTILPPSLPDRCDPTSETKVIATDSSSSFTDSPPPIRRIDTKVSSGFILSHPSSVDIISALDSSYIETLQQPLNDMNVTISNRISTVVANPNNCDEVCDDIPAYVSLDYICSVIYTMLQLSHSDCISASKITNYVLLHNPEVLQRLDYPGLYMEPLGSSEAFVLVLVGKKAILEEEEWHKMGRYLEGTVRDFLEMVFVSQRYPVQIRSLQTVGQRSCHEWDPGKDVLHRKTLPVLQSLCVDMELSVDYMVDSEWVVPPLSQNIVSSFKERGSEFIEMVSERGALGEVQHVVVMFETSLIAASPPPIAASPSPMMMTTRIPFGVMISHPPEVEGSKELIKEVRLSMEESLKVLLSEEDQLKGLSDQCDISIGSVNTSLVNTTNDHCTSEEELCSVLYNVFSLHHNQSATSEQIQQSILQYHSFFENNLQYFTGYIRPQKGFTEFVMTFIGTRLHFHYDSQIVQTLIQEFLNEEFWRHQHPLGITEVFFRKHPSSSSQRGRRRHKYNNTHDDDSFAVSNIYMKVTTEYYVYQFLVDVPLRVESSFRERGNKFLQTLSEYDSRFENVTFVSALAVPTFPPPLGSSTPMPTEHAPGGGGGSATFPPVAITRPEQNWTGVYILVGLISGMIVMLMFVSLRKNKEDRKKQKVVPIDFWNYPVEI